MAVINKQNKNMEFPLQIKRQYGAGIDTTELWYNLEEAKEYANSNPLAYAGQTIKVIDEARGTVVTYTIQTNGTLKAESNEDHVHSSTEIAETSEKKFISGELLAKLKDDTYTKSEIDQKFSGLVFKGTYALESDLPSDAKDGWMALVVDDPKYNKQNVVFIYESLELAMLKDSRSPSGWVKLNELIVPGVATAVADGLMSSEAFNKLTQLGLDVAQLKLGEAISAIAAAKVMQDPTHRFVTDAEKTSYADKFTKEETTTKLTELENKVTQAYTGAIETSKTSITEAYTQAIGTLSTKVDEIDKAYKAADAAINQKLIEVDAKLQPATDEQIDQLFAQE